MSLEHKALLITSIVIALGTFFVIMNGATFINNAVLKKKPSSFTPLLGGFLLYFGLSCTKQPILEGYAYLAFL